MVRIISLANLAYFVLATASPKYSREVANWSYSWITTGLWILTSLLLPLYVAFAIYRARKSENQATAMCIDASLAIVCFAAFVGVILHAFAHVVPF